MTICILISFSHKQALRTVFKLSRTIQLVLSDVLNINIQGLNFISVVVTTNLLTCTHTKTFSRCQESRNSGMVCFPSLE